MKKHYATVKWADVCSAERITWSLDKVSGITSLTVLQTVILDKYSRITGQMLQNSIIF